MQGVGAIMGKSFARWFCAVVVLFGAAPAEVSGYGFDVDVSVSPKAAALLNARREAIVVFALYEGFPIPAKRKLADDQGMIGLGNEEVQLPPNGGRVHVIGHSYRRERESWVKEPMVLINVVSARLSSTDNLLACDTFEDGVAKAREKPIAIFCKTLDEEFGPL